LRTKVKINRWMSHTGTKVKGGGRKATVEEHRRPLRLGHAVPARAFEPGVGVSYAINSQVRASEGQDRD